MRLNLLLASAAVVAMSVSSAQAQGQTAPAQAGQPVEVEIDQGVLKPLQIAIVPFTGDHGADISNVVSGNLRRSGFFEPLNPAGFIETGLTLANAPNFPQWTQIGAQAVLYGGVTPRGDGRLDVGFRLYDPYRQCQLVSYQFTATQEQWRRIAHKISDVIYQRMTGETGFFDSRVVFVSEEGTQLNRINRLTIADQDGFNPTYLTQGDEIIMSPRFSTSQPDEITYVALGKDYSRIYLRNLTTGRTESLGEFDGQVLAPRFSNDGDGPAQPAAVAPDVGPRHRHLAVVQPGRQPDRVQLGPVGPGALVCDAGRRLGPAADLARRRNLYGAGLEPDGQSDRLHQERRRPVLDRGDERRRVGRTHPVVQLFRGRPELGPQRPLCDVRAPDAGRGHAAVDRGPVGAGCGPGGL